MTLTREQFLERRKSGIGGSDVAAVMGLSKWKTPYQLWQEKTGKEIIDDGPESDLLHFGNVLEQVVAQEFSRRNELKVERRNKLFRKEDCLLANIDRYIVGEKAILECKTADKFTRHLWGEEFSDDIPEYYLTQVMHYMYVTGYRDAWLAVLIGGNEYRQFHIRYNADLAELLADRCVNFWDKYVKTDTPPPATTNEDLLSMYTASAGLSITANERIIEACDDLKGIKENIKSLKSQQENIELEIKNYMTESDILVGPTGEKLVTWKESTSNRLNTTTLKKELPDVAELYTTKIVSRRFLLK